ncbi:hypothetical protein RhiirA4_472632 [Rhizophagus irregularis]|uniref:Uncharacterized protein n=1 Tax=Rhizophagus irregularis TaxID=588596 RepID=A0A2I1H595_9GLOM|nr:hypothetical protein RhiirA4_472632 [Rhizophagus irregularis]
MVFQSTLPIPINEIPKEIRKLNANTPLFGMTLGMRVMQNKVVERLLNFKISKSGNLSYNKNLDVEIIEKKIITQCDFGCLIPPPNVVILTPTGFLNDDKIFCATQMYKEEFSLNDDEYLNICANEAIFRSYRIFHLATAIGVQFLDKLQAIVDYHRSTRRVLELNIGIKEIPIGPTDQNICVKACHLIGIRIDNYELQRDSLTAFALLFPAVGKNNYTTSVAHFLSILKKYPNLKRKLQYCASINLARKENLVEVFQMDNYMEHELFKKNSPLQLTPEGLVKLNNTLYV